MKKRKLVNKKGISLVVAMALSIFLLMITGTFLSVSILQQEDTGSEMNTRQAYVDAKSNLQTAEDFLKSEIEAGNLSLPSEDASIYVVLYYDSTGKLCCEPFDTAAEAKYFIKNFATEKPGCTLLSDTYIKITNNGGGSYTMSAFSAYDKYTTDSESFGDLSTKFTATTTKVDDGYTVNVDAVVFDNDNPTFSSSSSNTFLMVGAQSSFSLLNSVHQGYKTMNSETKNMFIPWVETNTTPINSYFPIVFTKPVKITSTNGRCTYKAYNNGIYYFGNSSSDDYIASDYRSNGNDPKKLISTKGQYKPTDVCWLSNNASYGSAIQCEFVTFAHNVLGRKDGAQKILEIDKYGKIDNGSNVVVYLPNGASFIAYNGNNQIESVKTYSAGFYRIASGSDIFYTNMTRLNDNSAEVKNIQSINLYDTMVDPTTKQVKDIRSGFEAESKDGSKAVNILYDNATFSTSAGSASYSTGEKNLISSSYTTYVNEWKNTSIYCGPARVPNSTGVYDLYSGESFNLVWNNTKPFALKDGVTMNLRSNNIVLTFGIGDGTKEYSYKELNSNGDWNGNIIDNTFESLGSGYKLAETVTSSNVLKQENATAKFTLNPYIGGSTYSLTVMEKMEVQCKACTYTIYPGVYTSNLPNGLDLFTTTARDYFADNAPNGIGGNNQNVNWVNSDGTICQDVPSDQSDNYIIFAPTSNANPLFNNANYTAKMLYCDFSSFDTLYLDKATLTADKILINAKEISGNSLWLNSKQKNCKLGSTNVLTGKYVTLNSDTTFKSGNSSFTMDAGTYFFNTNSAINLLDIESWNNSYIEKSATSYYVHDFKDVTNVTLSEGKYY